jgi:two-component system response regulator LytT
MTILIVEDEIKTAKALQQIIQNIEPQTEILGVLQSVNSAVEFLSDSRPDVIFMDIQLSDGLCFEIFNLVKITSPVIFCTAYDEYALDAFKANGIDYILKPFSQDKISGALDKIKSLKDFFQSPAPALQQIETLINRLNTTGKKGFLVFKNNRYLTVKTEDIAFFYIRNEMPMIMTYDQQEYPASQALDDIHSQLPPNQFYRVTRQYLVNYEAVKEVEHYFGRKLFVKLTIPSPDKLLIGKDKTSQFLLWLETR